MLGTEAEEEIPDLREVRRGRAEKRGDESVSGIVIDICGSAELANDSFVEHHDAVAHGHGLHLIMRDVDGRSTHAAMKALKLFARRGTELGVEVGEGFVEKKDRRLTHDGARERDALSLTAG